MQLTIIRLCLIGNSIFSTSIQEVISCLEVVLLSYKGSAHLVRRLSTARAKGI